MQSKTTHAMKQHVFKLTFIFILLSFTAALGQNIFTTFQLKPGSTSITSDGYFRYLLSTHKIQARINGVTENIATEAYVDAAVGGGSSSWPLTGSAALTGAVTIDASSFMPSISANTGEGLNITSDTDEPTLFFNSAASGNFRNWKIGGDGSDTYRGLTVYRSTTSGGSATTFHSKFTDNGSFIVGSVFGNAHFIYWQPKNAVHIGFGGGDSQLQDYDFMQGNNLQNSGTGTNNLLKGQSYSVAGVSKGNVISGESYSNITNATYNLMLEGGSTNQARDIGGSILIGNANTYNAGGSSDFGGGSALYNMQVGNFNEASKTHHLLQWGTGLRNNYGLTTWGLWTYQPKFIFGNANVVYTTAANKAVFVVANGFLSSASHVDANTYHSQSFTHFNNGWTQINATNDGFLIGGTELTEADVTPKAALEVVSTTSGILFPRMTATQFAAIPAGNLVDGMVVYESTNDKLKLRANGAWVDLN